MQIADIASAHVCINHLALDRRHRIACRVGGGGGELPATFKFEIKRYILYARSLKLSLGSRSFIKSFDCEIFIILSIFITLSNEWRRSLETALYNSCKILCDFITVVNLIFKKFMNLYVGESSIILD